MRARVIVGLVGAPIGIWAVWVGGIPFAAAMLFVACVAAYEYALMCRTRAWSPNAPLVVVASAMFVADAVFYNGRFTGLALTFVLLGSLFLEVAKGRQSTPWAGRHWSFASTADGPRQVLSHPVISRRRGRGLVLLRDPGVDERHGRFFTGRVFGRRKLSPGLSPSKTVEGDRRRCLTLAASVVFKALATQAACVHCDWLHACTFALAAGCGQLGDWLSPP